MKITITSPDLQREQQFAATFAQRLENEVEKPAVMEISLTGESEIKLAMPVLTGWARTNWGHFTPDLLLDMPEGLPAVQNVWEVERDGMAIVQGSDVPYMNRLNEGWSQQAPVGFVDSIALLMLEDLEITVGDGAEKLWRTG